jgi:hypothetical protein
MMTEPLTPDERRVLKRQIVHIHEQGWGISIGLVLGLGLLIATNVLVIKGGPTVGPHLGLLALYLPGYSVTFGGSLIGFVYAFVIGYACGRGVATIYNRLIDPPA